MSRARWLLALPVALLFTSAVDAQLYRWTDEKGGVHVTDTPPPPNARSVEQKSPRVEAAPGAPQLPYELALAVKEFPVTLYTSPGCKDACTRAREALNKRGVPFKEVPVSNDQTIEELRRVSGGTEVPVLLVGRSVSKGFEQSAYDALLDSARYPKAGTVPVRTQGAPSPEGAAAQADTSRADPAKPAAEEPARGPYSPGSRPPPRTQKK
jgi:glutaredoxin